MHVPRVLRSLGWLVRHPAFRRRPVRTILRGAAWEAAKIAGRPLLARLPWGPRLWCSPQRYRGVDGMIYVLREYERETSFVRAFVREGMTVLDVGANVGYYAVTMAELVGDRGRVHAFEPAADTRAKLARNLRANGVRNVLVHGVALADADETRTFYHAEDRGRSSLGPEDVVTAEEQVDCRRLDGLLPPETRIDFVKIDIEGAELLALRGARATLDRCPDAPILCELNAAKCRAIGHGIEDLVRWLHAADYRFLRWDAEAGRLRPIEAPAAFHGNAILVRRGHEASVARWLEPGCLVEPRDAAAAGASTGAASAASAATAARAGASGTSGASAASASAASAAPAGSTAAR